MRPRPAPRVPDQTVVVARAAFPKGSPAMSARDELADVFGDEQFAAAFGMRGAPAESPGALALVTVLQYVENLTDRQAAVDGGARDRLEIRPRVGTRRSRLRPERAEQVPRPAGRTRSGTGGVRQDAGGAGGRGPGRGRRQAAHRFHPRGLGGARPEPAGAGRGVGAGLPGSPRGRGPGLAGQRDRRQRVEHAATGPGSTPGGCPASATKRERLAELYGSDALALLRAIHAAPAPRPGCASCPRCRSCAPC